MEPNILITNSCNQNCSFCFAKDEMSRSLLSKHMNLISFKKTVRKLKRLFPSPTIKLMGGEPTIHPEFISIIQYALTQYDFVQLFTNGLFSLTIAKELIKLGKKLSIIFNVSTPGFQTNLKIRRSILQNIDRLAQYNYVGLSFTYDAHSSDLLKIVPIRTLNTIQSVRLSIINPQKKFSLPTFRSLGTITLNYIKQIHAISPTTSLLLNCGYTPCMFTTSQKVFLKKIGINLDKIWGCYGKDGSFDIGVDGKAFSCFVHSANNTGIDTKTDKKLALSKYVLRSKMVPEYCKTCQYYLKECPGPCLLISAVYCKIGRRQ